MTENTILFGRYRLLRRLGEGGMGVVWLARDEQLRHDVALKVVPPQLAHDRRATSELRRETAIALKLTHPNIVRTYDFHSDGDTAAVVMEHVKGTTLRSLSADEPHHCFAPDRLVPWLEQIIRALHYAHTEVHVVHRDIKPANVMLSELENPLKKWQAEMYRKWRVQLADFGIARVIAEGMTQLSTSTQPSNSSGTLPYMSPQQIDGQPPEPKDDVYALGATIYELLTGETPIRGLPAAIIAKAMDFDSRVERMSERRARLYPDADLPPIPPAWDAAVDHALRKDRNLRTRNVDTFASELGIERPSVSTQNLSNSIWMSLKRRVLPNIAQDAGQGDLLPLVQQIAACFQSPLKEEWLSLLGVAPDATHSIQPIAQGHGQHREKQQIIAAMAAIQDAFARGLDHPLLFALRAECYQQLNLHSLAVSDLIRCLAWSPPSGRNPPFTLA